MQQSRAAGWQRMFTWRPAPEGEPAAGSALRRLTSWRHGITGRLAAMPGRRLAALGAAAVVIAAALGTGIGYLISGPPGTRITAYFTEATGIYPGTNVRILGVPVGTIDSVQPEGTRVKVTMTVNHGVAVPAGADAVVVAPTVIAARYLQLTPAYTGGPRMPPGGTIPVSRTATPVEIDQIYSSVSKFLNELGPQGVNKHGALSNALNVGAANLQGNGKAFGTMIQQFGQAMRTLSGSETNFFGTVNNLNTFSAMLKSNNSQVRQSEQQLAQVFGFLSADRNDLAGALHELAIALSQVKSFIQDNRAALKSNVTKLQEITKILANQRASLAESLDASPLAADNFLNAYNPSNGTLTGRGDLNEISAGCTKNPNCGESSPAGSTGSSGSPGSQKSSGSQGGSGQASPGVPLPLPAVGTPAGSSGGGR